MEEGNGLNIVYGNLRQGLRGSTPLIAIALSEADLFHVRHVRPNKGPTDQRISNGRATLSGLGGFVRHFAKPELLHYVATYLFTF